MSTNFQATNMYTDRSKDTFQKNDTRKNINKESPIEVELMKNKNRIIYNQYKKQDFPDRNKSTKINDERGQFQMRPQTLSGSYSSIPGHAPTFEIFNTHTLVAKSNQLGPTRSTKSATTKSRPHIMLHPHQPVITIKQHYNSAGALNNSDPVPKLIRHPNHNNLDEMRSMSAVIKSQSKIEPNISKSVSLKPANKPSNSKSHNRVLSANNIGNNSRELPNYDSLSRSRNKAPTKISDPNNDPNLIYYSLPRKSKNHIPNESKSSNRTKPITMTHKHKIAIDPSNAIESTTTIATDSNDTNPINFSSTLAKAATNSPPIKRRSSSIIHSPNPRMPARFASRSIINEMYTTKNYQENREKYKKAANEILRENLALKFGSNTAFLNQLNNESVQSRSSVSSISSTTSSGTDQQISISSIPHDDIPLDIPNKPNTVSIPKPDEPPTEITIKNPNIKYETEEVNDIVQGMVTFDNNLKEDADMVHLSDEDNDEYGEYDLDDEQSSSASCTSESEGEDIENLKKKFIPLYEIERMVDDFALSNEIGGLPDHQHSQSFRVENTSVASNTEVFVHKGSLQKAKDALLTEPSQGILSTKLSENSENRKIKKRKAVFDPHILLLDACLEPDFELVKELAPKVPNISKKTIDGITALHNAVCSADPKLVLFLLQSGADVNASDADGWTPLHCAACCNNKQISKILVEHGASLFSVTLSDFEIPSQKCNKASQEDTICEEYLFWEQENLGSINGEIVYALFHYEPQRDDELSLVPNQILKVLDTNPPGESGWFFVEDLSQIVTTPRRGFVAAAYVSAYQLIMPQDRRDSTYYRP